MVKDIVVIADLGAAGNLVRNLLLLSDQIDWPLGAADRFLTISKQYLPSTQLKDWLPIEYQLRFWKKYYQVDLSDDIDIQQFDSRTKVNKPVVYLNHSAFYQQSQYQQLASCVKTLYVAPITDFGLLWQIRSYCEKKTVDQLHNFTFETNAAQQKLDYCNKHGIDAYYRLNVDNFKEIVSRRQKEFGTPDLTLEQLLFEPAADIVSTLFDKLNVSVDADQAQEIITAWRNLHWPIDHTTNWKYYDQHTTH